MSYYLYKLCFKTPVHFGADVAGIGLEKASPTCHADTLFSAFCQEILLIESEMELKKWVNRSKNGEFLISDLFPFYGDELFLPKPVLTRKKDMIIEKKSQELDQAKNKKQMKKLKFIPISLLSSFIDYLNGDQSEFDPRLNEEEKTFFEESVIPKVSIPRTEVENSLYSVAAYTFKDNAGLYFVVFHDNETNKNEFEKILESLQYSGIGGKRSSGYGRFSICKRSKLGGGNKHDKEEILYHLLKDVDGKKFNMSLSVISPNENDIENLNGSFYTLIPRKGFVSSSNYTNEENPVKRKQLVMINSGSCFEHKIEGQVIDVSDNGNHPVWRYGKAMMVGVL